MVLSARPSLRIRLWALLCYWAAIYFLTHWPEMDRLRFRPNWPYADKLVHGSFYAGWVFLWAWVLVAGGKPLDRTRSVWLLIAAAAYGIFDELTQAIVGRQPDVFDFAFDMLGSALALVLFLALQRRWVRRVDLLSRRTG